MCPFRKAVLFFSGYLLATTLISSVVFAASPKLIHRKGLRKISAEECMRQFGSLPKIGEEFGLEQFNQMEVLFNRLVAAPLNPELVREFLETGWPEFVRLAREEGKAPAELMKEVNEMLMYVFSEEYSNNPEQIKAFQANYNRVLPMIQWLSSKPSLTDAKKLKPNELPAITDIQNSLRNIAHFVASQEYNLFGSSTVNFALPVGAQQLRHVFRSLEDLGEEANLVKALREMREAQKPKAVVQSNDLSTARTETSSAQVTASVEAVPQHAHLPKPVARPRPTLSAEPVSLLQSLNEEIPLLEGQVYSFQNATQGDYTIQFGRNVIKSADRRHDRVVRRLLSTLFKGDGIKSGLKVLPSLGKDIVEIKTIMRGHWRLIGCLKGRSIVIKELMDLPDNRNSYFDRIDSKLCSE